MGTYYYVVNHDKQEYLHPHKLGNGLKLAEFAPAREGVMTALALLLANSDGLGTGHPLAGHWCKDRISILGDMSNQLIDVEDSYTDISLDARALLEAAGFTPRPRWDQPQTEITDTQEYIVVATFGPDRTPLTSGDLEHCQKFQTSVRKMATKIIPKLAIRK